MMSMPSDNSSAKSSDKSTYVLVVEPDQMLAETIRQDLRDAGYQAIVAHETQTGLQQVMVNPPALVIIDRVLVGESGFSFCTKLRQAGLRSPIVLMISKDTVDDRVACLAAGADDYFLKPYRSDQLLRLVEHYLKRDSVPQEVLQFSNLTLNLGSRQAFRNQTAIDLTMKEFELLRFLMEHPREVMTREQILENVWGDDFVGESNVIEVYIRYLRLKIEDEGKKRLIQTVRGVGYVLREV
jgi:two-component system, OmpR family, response regulator NblR